MTASSDDLKNKIETLVQSLNGLIKDNNTLNHIQNLYNDLMDTCTFLF